MHGKAGKQTRTLLLIEQCCCQGVYSLSVGSACHCRSVCVTAGHSLLEARPILSLSVSPPLAFYSPLLHSSPSLWPEPQRDAGQSEVKLRLIVVVRVYWRRWIIKWQDMTLTIVTFIWSVIIEKCWFEGVCKTQQLKQFVGKLNGVWIIPFFLHRWCRSSASRSRERCPASPRLSSSLKTRWTLWTTARSSNSGRPRDSTRRRPSPHLCCESRYLYSGEQTRSWFSFLHHALEIASIKDLVLILWKWNSAQCFIVYLLLYFLV